MDCRGHRLKGGCGGRAGGGGGGGGGQVYQKMAKRRSHRPVNTAADLT